MGTTRRGQRRRMVARQYLVDMIVSWEPVAVVAVGGLTDVGFSSDGRLLLVLGHQGRGVYECHTGARVARDDEDDWAFLDDKGLANGIGPLDGHRLQVAGLMSGGRLPLQSGPWGATQVDDGVLLHGPQVEHLGESEEVRVFGFDPTGRTFVLATSSTLRLFRLSPHLMVNRPERRGPL